MRSIKTLLNKWSSSSLTCKKVACTFMFFLLVLCCAVFIRVSEKIEGN